MASYVFCFDFHGGRPSWWFLVVVNPLRTGAGQDKEDSSDSILALILKGPSDGDVLWLPFSAQPSVDDTGNVFD